MRGPEKPALRFWSRSGSLGKVRAAFPDAFCTDDASEAVSTATEVVLCTPVGVMADLAGAFRGALSPEAVVTDAGSVKERIVSELEPILGEAFVGAHPMAGSELSGLGAARADLFDDAICVVTPGKSAAATETVRALWTGVGCRVVELSAAEHDRLVARSSHLPHAVASTLVQAVVSSTPEALGVIGNGFRDTTRIAGGEEALWAGIFVWNRREVLAALAEFRSSMEAFSALLESGDEEGMRKFLCSARKAQSLQSRRPT